MKPARRIGLLFGGRSVEHEVSVVSARGVRVALHEAGFECSPLAVAGDGRWLGPERSLAILETDARRAEPGVPDDGARVAVDPGGQRLLRFEPGAEPRPIEVDVLFPLVHGWGGEDGRLQGALELAGIPYVGAGVTGSAAAMDKIVSKKICSAHGLPLARWLAVSRAEYRAAAAGYRARVAGELGYPAFVKPANGGSSVGVSRVGSPAELAAALDKAFAYDHSVVVEEGLDAREIECALLGNDEPQASGVGEILPSREFYDYAAKYLDGTSQLKIPAELDPAIAAVVRRHAVAAFRALGLAGLARVDFLVGRQDGVVYLNEANTLPGFTPISMFPKLWQAEGLSFPDLVRRLVELALERWTADRSLLTRFAAN